MLDPILFHMMNRVSERQEIANRAVDQVAKDHRESLEFMRLLAFLLVLNLVLVSFAIYIR